MCKQKNSGKNILFYFHVGFELKYFKKSIMDIKMKNWKKNLRIIFLYYEYEKCCETNNPVK